MPTINDLPHELLRHILGQLCQADDAAALLAASLVARHWCAPAQAALWYDITLLQDAEEVEAILESSALGRYKTRSLAVEGSTASSESAKELLAAMVDLKVLRVEEGGFAHIEGSLFDEIWVFRGHLRGLKSLELYIDFTKSYPGPTLPAFALSSFTVGNEVRSRRVVQSIITSSASTLSTLFLQHPSEESYEAIISSLPLVGNTLTSLTFWTGTALGGPAAGFAHLKPAFASLVALEEFFLMVDEIETATLAIESLPSPVPVLEVEFNQSASSDSSAAAELVAAIGRAAWVGLRLLRFTSSSREVLSEMAEGPELLQMCAEKGIRVVFGDPVAQ